MADAAATIRVWVFKADSNTKALMDIKNITQFQTSIADGFDADKAIRFNRTFIVLGANGEFMTVEVTNNEGAAAFTAQGVIAFESTLIKNVIDIAQYGLYGKFSPFPTPTAKVSQPDLIGVDIEKHVVDTLTTGGLGSTRQTNSTTATLAAGLAEDRITVKPNSNEVFLVRKGNKLAADQDGFTKA